MNKTGRIAFGIGIALAVLVVLTTSATADNVVYFDPDPSCAAPGETITVTMWVNATDGVEGFQDDLYFDPNVVNITDVQPGFYTSYWMVIPYYEENFIRFGGDSPDFHDHTGHLILANVTLEAIGPGTGALNHADFPAAKLYDEYGNSVPNQVWIDGTFNCPCPTPETFTKDLVEGWNLISLPLTNETDMTVANIIDASLSGSYDALYKYDASAHKFVPLSSSDTMENGVGYFIHMTSADTWTYTGMAYKQMNVSLEPGLNMIGWLNCSKPIDNVLSSIDGDYWYVARWNATAQKFEVYNPVAPNGFNDFDTMERGKGYFISMKSAETLTASC